MLGMLAILLAACNAPTTPTADSGVVLTRAAADAIARLTEAAAQPSLTASVTLAPTVTPAPSTPVPKASPTTAPAPADTATPTSTSDPSSSAADSASYIADVDYPDNTPVIPGQAFTKTWRIRNTGATTWTTAYNLVCIDPGKFTCPASAAFSKEVKPGEMIDIQVNLTAPTQTGTQRAFFRLRNAAGQFFLLDGTGDLWVQVVVGSDSALTKTVTPTSGGPTNTLEPSATITNTLEPSATATP